MTNLEAIRQMNLKELAFFLSITRWDDLNSTHMIPKEDIDYFTNYLNKDGEQLIESIRYVMKDWENYNKDKDTNSVTKEADMKEIFEYLTKDIPTWKIVLIDKWTDFKVWFIAKFLVH